tara:strand:+ start:1831 stop:2907 length:1077 start_codon:yes stop_codon:yes gene_type:complete
MITYYGQQSTGIETVLRQLNPDMAMNIGVIHWWSTWDRPMQEMERFVDGVDICFVVSDEILCNSIIHGKFGGWVKLQSQFDMLDQDKVHFILHSDEPLMPNSNRCFNVPWFAKTPVTNYNVEAWDYVDKQYTFNMLLGSEKDHRTHLFLAFKDNKNIYSTYFGHNGLKNISDKHLEDEDVLNNLQGQVTFDRKINTLEEVNESTISHTTPQAIYDNSHFDIVSETHIDDDFFFTTEKTAKPLAAGRWFLPYTSRNQSSYLERYGFDFSDYRHDEYDVKDKMHRLELTIQKIEEISEDNGLVRQIYSETRENRIHNAHVYKQVTKKYMESLTFFILDALSIPGQERTKILEVMLRRDWH